MLVQEFDLHDFMEAREVEPCGRPWPVECPFNLRFTAARLSPLQRQAITGTGIYLISRGEEVVYLGLFRPQASDIVGARWARHMQTITARGSRIGLGTGGAKGPEVRLHQLLNAVDHPALRAALQVAYEHDRAERFRSSGNDTTANRLRFASENWDVFSTATQTNILNSFTFTLLRIRPAATQEQAREEIEDIERNVLAAYKPACNDQYSHLHHARDRRRNRLEVIVSATRSAMRDRTGSDASHCTVLYGLPT